LLRLAAPPECPPRTRATPWLTLLAVAALQRSVDNLAEQASA
jgi:hypothetical protein